MSLRTLTVGFLLAALVLTPTEGRSQGLTASVGVGAASGWSDLGDATDGGFTLRGQLGVDLLVASVHGQVGWTRLPGRGDADDFSTAHYGVGGRLGLGLLWVGLNGAYFSGDGDDGMGFFPEVGVGLGPLEAVADVRVDGDQKWWSLRGAFRF
jgi:hypothetical protein